MTTEKSKLSASLEDYLEAIFQIIAEKGAARPKDISTRLGVKNSSITEALITLSKKKLINYAPYELISLTSKGQSVARKVVKRHNILHRFFTKILLIGEKESEEIACKVEHVIGPNILKKLETFINFTHSCPRAGEEWLKKAASFNNAELNIKECSSCMKKNLTDMNKKEIFKKDLV